MLQRVGAPRHHPPVSKRQIMAPQLSIDLLSPHPAFVRMIGPLGVSPKNPWDPGDCGVRKRLLQGLALKEYSPQVGGVLLESCFFSRKSLNSLCAFFNQARALAE